MKLLKHLLSMAIVLSLSLGCGKKSASDTISGTAANTQVTTTSNSNSNFTAAQASSVNNFQSIYACKQGQRLSQVVNYHTSQAQSQNGQAMLSGTFNEGLMSGTVGQLFFGVSYWNDLMVVSKVINGSQVLGFNISVYMCSWQKDGIPYVDNSRALSNFQANYGIVIGDNVNCSFGQVANAQNTSMQSGSTQHNNITLPIFNVETSFFPVPNCF